MSTVTSPLFHELVAALEELTALVRGECPAILDDDRGGLGRLSNEIDCIFAAIKTGRPLITVSPSMITAAQDAFIEVWRRGVTPDWAVTCAVHAAVNHINNSIKERP